MLELRKSYMILSVSLLFVMDSVLFHRAFAGDPSAELVTDMDTDEFGGSPDCDTTCKGVISSINSICDSQGQQSANCIQARENQLYYQCIAYDQMGWTAFFDTYMLALDSFTAGFCTASCISLVRGGALGIPLETVCNGLAVLDMGGELGDSISLNMLLGNNWAGTSTFDQVNTALEIVGMTAGIMGL